MLCGLDIKNIREICLTTDCKGVHGTNHYVKGVANSRGQIVTILDLRKRLSLVELPDDQPHKVLVIEDGEEKIGLVVDEVDSIITTVADKFDTQISNIEELERKYYQGVYRLEKELVVFLDAEGILFDESVSNN